MQWFKKLEVQVREKYRKFESLKIVEQVMGDIPKGPFKIQDKKITPPPRKRLDESMEALIHHFKIYTE